MANFSDLFPDDQLMTALGDDITYQPSGGGSFPIEAIVEHAVERVGAEGYTVDPRTEIEFLKSDLPNYPKSGDRIASGKDHFIVDTVIFDEGTYVRLAVKS